MIPLKPCPFCGGKARREWQNGRYGFFGIVSCEVCGAQTRAEKLSVSPNEVDPEEFINAYQFEKLATIWNMREDDNE